MSPPPLRGAGSIPERAIGLWETVLSTLDQVDEVDLEEEIQTAKWAWSGSRNADFIMLWVASTARSLDETLDPLSLQEQWTGGWHPGLLPYNGRGIADALGSWNAGNNLWIGTTSPNPMNTGNYLSKLSLLHVFGIGDAADVDAAIDGLRKQRDRDLVRLIQTFADLSPQRARRYVTACLLLARLSWITRNALEDFAGTARPFYEVITACEVVLTEHSEAGRWGEAFVAAALETIDADVRAKGAQISRYFAGDVLATLPNQAHLTVEVRQKYEPNGPMTFGASLAEKRGDQRDGKTVIGTNLSTGIYIELPPVPEVRRSQSELKSVRDSTGTFVISLSGVFDVVTTLLTSSPLSELEFASRFPALFDAHLQRQEVEDLDAWRGLFH